MLRCVATDTAVCWLGDGLNKVWYIAVTSLAEPVLSMFTVTALPSTKYQSRATGPPLYKHWMAAAAAVTQRQQQCGSSVLHCVLARIS